MKTYKQITPEMIQKDIRYLELLSHDFPNLAAASTEIINLEAILNLPKGTEHFLATCTGNTKLSSMCSAMLPELSNGR